MEVYPIHDTCYTHAMSKLTLTLAPNDKDAALKLAECEKLVKRINFEKAIEVDEPLSPSAGLEIDKMGKRTSIYFFITV